MQLIQWPFTCCRARQAEAARIALAAVKLIPTGGSLIVLHALTKLIFAFVCIGKDSFFDFAKIDLTVLCALKQAMVERNLSRPTRMPQSPVADFAGRILARLRAIHPASAKYIITHSLDLMISLGFEGRRAYLRLREDLDRL